MLRWNKALWFAVQSPQSPKILQILNKPLKLQKTFGQSGKISLKSGHIVCDIIIPSVARSCYNFKFQTCCLTILTVVLIPVANVHGMDSVTRFG